MCTFENCTSADHKYSRRRDWQRHLTNSHNRHWVCAFGCTGQISHEEDFREHLHLKHGHNLDSTTLKHLSDACAVADGVVDLTCPLCRVAMPSSQRWFKHVGNHLQQFALHALPLHMLASDSDDEADTGLKQRSDSDATDSVHNSSENAVEASTHPPVKVVASSYWSVPEQSDFVKYIGYFGRDFAAIAAHMGTKTQTMIKNHYERQVDGGNHPELEQLAMGAEERRMCGEVLGPPPQPTPMARRKYPVEDEEVRQSSPLELEGLPAGERERGFSVSEGLSQDSESTEDVYSDASDSGNPALWPESALASTTFAGSSVETPQTTSEWFIPGAGIEKHIIYPRIKGYLGKDATVRAGWGEGIYKDIRGYRIIADRNLTAAMIDKLRTDSEEWRQQRRKRTRKRRQARDGGG